MKNKIMAKQKMFSQIIFLISLMVFFSHNGFSSEYWWVHGVNGHPSPPINFWTATAGEACQLTSGHGGTTIRCPKEHIEYGSGSYPPYCSYTHINGRAGSDFLSSHNQTRCEYDFALTVAPSLINNSVSSKIGHFLARRGSCPKGQVPDFQNAKCIDEVFNTDCPAGTQPNADKTDCEATDKEEVSELGNPATQDNLGNECSDSLGCPEWRVNPRNLNVYIEDTPLWYQPAYGARVNFKIHYNSLGNYHDPSTTAFGAGFKTSLNAYLEIDGSNIIVTMPDGRQDGYTLSNNSAIGRHGHVLQKLDAQSYELHTSNGDIYHYSQSIDNKLYLTQKTQQGLVSQFIYSNNRLSAVQDPSGGQLTLAYLSDGLSISDNKGRSAKIVRTATGISLTDAQGLLSTLTLDSNGAVTALRKPQGDAWTFSPAADALTVNHPDGRVDQYAYVDGDLTLTQTKGDQVRTISQSYAHDAAAALPFTVARQVGDMQSQLSFTNNHRIGQRVDAAQKTTAYVYNDYGQLTQQQEIDPDANITRTTEYTDYLSKQVDLPQQIKQPSVYAGADKITGIRYDAQYNLDVVTTSGYDAEGNAVSRSVDYDYDAQNRLKRIDRPRTDVNDITDYQYYADCSNQTRCGRLRYITNALGQKTEFLAYNAAGLPTQTKDSNGLVYDIGYDNLDRITSIKTTAGSDVRTTSYTYYGAKQQLDTATYPNRLQLKHEYNVANQLTTLTVSHAPVSGVATEYYTISYQHDVRGNVSKKTVIDSESNITELLQTFEYPVDDMYNRLQSVSAQDRDFGIEYRYGDNATGWTARYSNLEGGPDHDYIYDAFGRLKAMQQKNASAINHAFQHDIQDNRTRVETSQGAVTTYTYDDLGNRLTENSADRGLITYTYDAAGNMKTRKDARGITVTYSYDALNRITKIDYPASSSGYDEDVHYYYDNCTPQGGFNVNAVGRLCRVKDQAGVHDYQYDIYGNVTRVRNASNLSGKVYTTVYAYDQMNRLTNLTYPSGKRLEYIRNPQGFITEIKGHQSGVHTLVKDRTFRHDGQLLTQTFLNGIVETREYSTAGDMTDQTLEHTSNNEFSFPQLRYHIDEKYGVESITFDEGSHPLSPDTAAFNAQRLWTFQGFTYSYDDDGSRTSLTNNASNSTVNYVYAPDSHQLKTVNRRNVIYDAAGNTTRDYNAANQMRSYQYNRAGRLSKSDHAGQDTDGYYYYRYDGLRGSKKTTEDVRTEKRTCVFFFACWVDEVINQDQVRQRDFVYDLQGRLLAEYVDGELVMEYAWDDNMLVGAADDNQITSDPNFFNPLDTSQESVVINDHLNTPRAAFNGNSTLIWRWNDYGFGAQKADEDPDGDKRHFRLGIRFAGQYYDTETQLHYNHHRYYDAEKGRYVTSDPIGLQGGLNTYAYVNANPVNYVDPLGLLPPADIPPHVDIEKNIEEAQNMSISEFYNAVRNKGKWDYKQLDSQYEAFGNYHFGVVAKAFGLPGNIPNRGAGYAQQCAGTSNPNWGSWWSWPSSSNSFGDDPIDQIWINHGKRDYSNNFWTEY